MGFMVAKSVRFYSMSLSEILRTASRRFFWLYSQIERIEADEDLRHLRVAVAAQSNQEGFEQVHSGLAEQRGETMTYRTVQLPYQEADQDENTLDPNFDREGLARLRARHG